VAERPIFATAWCMPETINILWTGGWDSSFQLVKSYIHGTTAIQPIYIVDESRQSTAMELLAIKRIKQTLRSDFPARADSLLPLRLFAVSDLQTNQRITGAYTRIHERRRIGVQYDWFARFCDQCGVSELQLCIHRDDRAHAALRDLVEDGREGLNNYRVSEKHVGTDEYELFKYFSFPIFEMTKREMQEHAQELDFTSIMNLTWFCHAPKDGRPCGRCLPCRFTIDEGLGWRVPYLRRLHGALVWSVLRPAKTSLRKIPTWLMCQVADIFNFTPTDL
jgi:hypothetical protein